MRVAGDPSAPLRVSPCSLNSGNCQQDQRTKAYKRSTATRTHLSVSLLLDCVFFRLGVGILHSMPKAVQLVHGTPRLAASHRT